jgi:hypothetical protein
MDLKTHTAYPEIQVSEAFDWMLADQSGRVDNPVDAPKGADIDIVFPWEAKIIGVPAESFEDFVSSGGNPEDFKAPLLDLFAGTATSRQAAIDAALAEIAEVQDGYLRPTEETAQ